MEMKQGDTPFMSAQWQQPQCQSRIELFLSQRSMFNACAMCVREEKDARRNRSTFRPRTFLEVAPNEACQKLIQFRLKIRKELHFAFWCIE